RGRVATVLGAMEPCRALAGAIDVTSSNRRRRESLETDFATARDGKPSLFRPFRAMEIISGQFPGRCPGLYYFGPSGRPPPEGRQQASPGHRPGLSPKCNRIALKGRNSPRGATPFV